MLLSKIIKKAIRNRSFYEPVEWGWKRSFGLTTRSKRLLPNFIIIGAQKCGTTSLFNYLSEHPDIYPSYPKEVHFFSTRFNRGIKWYRSHFPLAIQKEIVERINNHRFLTGEASPSYFANPHAPRRVSKVVPNVLLIILLRNPVDRAYSHYHMSKKMGLEKLSFTEALDQEDERLSSELEKMIADEYYRSSILANFSYLRRGIYIEHLLRWSKFFKRDRMFFINSEEFYSNPRKSFQQVEEILGISSWELNEYKRYASGNYAPMDSKTRKRLQEFFEPYNQKLYDFLGLDFRWED